MNRPIRRLSAAAAAIVATLALGAFTGTAGAVTETRTVPAEIVFINGAKAGAPGNCSALVFLRWADAPGTVSGIGHFQFNATPATKVLTPPFDDTGEWVIPYAVAPGYHWVMLSKSWVAGPVPDDCSSFRASQQATYTGPASVDLTLDVPKSQTAACTTAKAAAVVTRTKVAAARKALANARPRSERRRPAPLSPVRRPGTRRP